MRGHAHDTDQQDMLLGDIVISQALVQYDYGRQYPGRFERKTGLTETLGRSNPEIRATQKKLGTTRYKRKMQESIIIYLQEIHEELPYTKYPGKQNDILYESSYLHNHRTSTTCECSENNGICEAAHESDCKDLGCASVLGITRSRLVNASMPQPMVHFGIIGSGNSLMKSGQHRDQVANMDRLIAFEVGGAGVWNIFPPW